MGKKREKKSDKYEKLVSLLIENFVNLQKIFTKTSEKFEELSEQISKLLQLFEISAKSFAEKLGEKIEEIERDKEFLEKLDKLLEQNKLIAKGLTLMEERLRERVSRMMPQPPLRLNKQPQFKPQTSVQQTKNLSPSIIDKKESE